MSVERRMFEPESIQRAFHPSVSAGLRALADAVDAGDVECRVGRIQGNGFTNWQDTRVHVDVCLDVAAHVFEWRAGEKVPLPPPTLELPA